MIPVRDLLSRIRWDKEFGAGFFEIGYLDHVEGGVVRIPFKRIIFEEGNRFSFQIEDENGELLNIPFHRIREVYKDGIPIWQRSEGR